MKLIFIGILFISLTSCDVANKSRSSRGAIVYQSSQKNPGSNSNNGNSGNNGNNNGNGRTPGSTPNNSNIPTDASQCTWKSSNVGNYQYPITGTSIFGRYNICKSSSNPNKIYIQLETPDTNYNLCLIPTSHVGSNSFYIGEPRCFLASSSTKIYAIDILKNRANFTQYNMTGLIILKDKLNFYPAPYYQNSLNPDAYLYCSEVLYQKGVNSYCQTFKNLGKYLYHQF